MKADNELYRQLRELPPQQLWTEEVPKFDRLSPKERNQQVALVRAVGVVFSTSRNPEMKAAVKAWMVGLLQDPNEKIRRYATAAIPKLGGDESSEKRLLDILQTTQVDREKRKVAEALEKIGGAETLKVVAGKGDQLVSEQKVRASVARQESPGAVRLEAVLPKQDGLKLHLRCRAGLESIVADEVREAEARQGKFRVVEVRGTCVVVEPKGPFALADLYRFRCFDTASFVLGLVRSPQSPAAIGELAKLIASPRTEFLMKALTEGALRYRLSMLAEGNHDAAVAKVITGPTPSTRPPTRRWPPAWPVWPASRPTNWSGIRSAVRVSSSSRPPCSATSPRWSARTSTRRRSRSPRRTLPRPNCRGRRALSMPATSAT